MSDPYEILGVTPQADEAEIRRRSLALVREFPPERAPERFAAIRVAYDEVRNPARRLAAQAGMPLPKVSHDDEAREQRQRTLYDVLDLAAKYFEATLASARGAKAAPRAATARRSRSSTEAPSRPTGARVDSETSMRTVTARSWVWRALDR